MPVNSTRRNIQQLASTVIQLPRATCSGSILAISLHLKKKSPASPSYVLNVLKYLACSWPHPTSIVQCMPLVYYLYYCAIMFSFSCSVVLFSTLLLAVTHSDQVLKEDLFITHLPDSRTLAHFEFSVTWSVHPLTLAEGFKGAICLCFMPECAR